MVGSLLHKHEERGRLWSWHLRAVCGPRAVHLHLRGYGNTFSKKHRHQYKLSVIHSVGTVNNAAHAIRNNTVRWNIRVYTTHYIYSTVKTA